MKESRLRPPSSSGPVSKAPPQRLPKATADRLSSRLGTDVSDVPVVPVPAGSRYRPESAYTTQGQVVIDASRYRPGSAAGERLLAHELTHVLQQSRGRTPEGGIGRPGDPLERQADAVSERVGHGRPATDLTASLLAAPPVAHPAPSVQGEDGLLPSDPVEAGLIDPEATPAGALFAAFDPNESAERHFGHIHVDTALTIGMGHWASSSIAGFFAALLKDSAASAALLTRLEGYFSGHQDAWTQFVADAGLGEGAKLNGPNIRSGLEATLANKSWAVSWNVKDKMLASNLESSETWTSGYVLYCKSDSNGVNVREQSDTSENLVRLGETIDNGTPVEVRRVEASKEEVDDNGKKEIKKAKKFVEFRLPGVEPEPKELESKRRWAPLGYLYKEGKVGRYWGSLLWLSDPAGLPTALRDETVARFQVHYWQGDVVAGGQNRAVPYGVETLGGLASAVSIESSRYSLAVPLKASVTGLVRVGKPWKSVEYTGAADWRSGYTLWDKKDKDGTNMRLRTPGTDEFDLQDDRRIPNGATGVELREVYSSNGKNWVRIRHDGTDNIDEREIWVPLDRVAVERTAENDNLVWNWNAFPADITLTESGVEDPSTDPRYIADWRALILWLWYEGKRVSEGEDYPRPRMEEIWNRWYAPVWGAIPPSPSDLPATHLFPQTDIEGVVDGGHMATGSFLDEEIRDAAGNPVWSSSGGVGHGEGEEDRLGTDGSAAAMLETWAERRHSITGEEICGVGIDMPPCTLGLSPTQRLNAWFEYSEKNDLKAAWLPELADVLGAEPRIDDAFMDAVYEFQVRYARHGTDDGDIVDTPGYPGCATRSRMLEVYPPLGLLSGFPLCGSESAEPAGSVPAKPAEEVVIEEPLVVVADNPSVEALDFDAADAVSWYGKADGWDDGYVPFVSEALGIDSTEVDEAFVTAVARFQFEFIGGDHSGVDGKAGADTRLWLTEVFREVEWPEGFVTRTPRKYIKQELFGKVLDYLVEQGRVDPEWAGRSHKDYMEDVLVEATFLGRRIRGGAHPLMVERLKAAEAELGRQPDFHGIGDVTGYSAHGSGFHNWGLAIDLDVTLNPYVMHEYGEGNIDDLLEPVYHRIAGFMLARESVIPDGLNVGHGIEENRVLHEQLRQESAAMQIYFRMMKNPEELVNYLTDVAAEDQAIGDAKINAMGTQDAAEILRKMAADWTKLTMAPLPEIKAPNDTPIEAPEKVNLVGDQDLPFKDRDPQTGFISLRWEVVEALLKQGFIWGASGFGEGRNGDIMHFDLRCTDLGQAILHGKGRKHDCSGS